MYTHSSNFHRERPKITIAFVLIRKRVLCLLFQAGAALADFHFHVLFFGNGPAEGEGVFEVPKSPRVVAPDKIIIPEIDLNTIIPQELGLVPEKV